MFCLHYFLVVGQAIGIINQQMGDAHGTFNHKVKYWMSLEGSTYLHASNRPNRHEFLLCNLFTEICWLYRCIKTSSGESMLVDSLCSFE